MNRGATTSFLIDLPALFLSGLAIYYLGRKLQWDRHAKIVMGIAIAFVFIAFSTLLYLDIIRCPFPFFSWMKGSDFMLNSNLTGISKVEVPAIIALLLFLIYPVWIYMGYASALLVKKKRLVSKEIYTYSDIKSKKRAGKTADEAEGDTKAGPGGRFERKEASIYSVTRGNDTRKCVRDAIDILGGIGKFVKNGDKVLVKVNICGGVPEIKGSYTSTDVADELVDLIRSAGGEPILADADMIWTKFWQAAADSGWVDWAKKKGVRLVNLSETRIVNFNFGYGSVLGQEKVSRDCIDADVIVSLPTMKTHLLTGVTLGMKNMYGTFPDVDKAKYHRKGIERTIYEVNAAFTPKLVVIDGSIGGEATGPLSIRPVYCETIVASNDVVLADSVACQIMGYDPMDITHIRLAHEAGLGNASVKFDLDLLPYSHPGGKDGNWERPDPPVKDFYEWSLELLLQIPGWRTLFDTGADFFLYDLARLPVSRNITPVFLKLLNDVVYQNLKDLKDTKKSVSRIKANISIMALVALTFAASYYMEGYIWHFSLVFELSYLLAIVIAMVAAAKMRTRDLAALLLSTALVSAIVEHTNISSGLLSYTGSPDVSLFVLSGWMVMMVVILQLSDILREWLAGLKIFTNLKKWNVLPAALAFIIFALFFQWEGYISIAKREVLLMYAAMMVISLIYSWRHSTEWNVSVMVVALATGAYMELLGSLAGFWQYNFKEILAVFFALTWIINTWAIYGLTLLAGIDLGSHKPHSATMA